MNEVHTALAFLDRLTGRGGDISAALHADPWDANAQKALRAWQSDVAAAINELSGGSKAHWLSKAFSAAFLITSPRHGDGTLVLEASAVDIVDRLLHVLAQGRASLMQVAAGAASFEPPPPRRFEFVRDAALRPVVEQAYIDAERALERGDAEHAFMTFCGVLEAIITDALGDASHGRAISDMSFDERIAAAESEGLIHASCARLPPSARQYRERRDRDAAPSTRDADIVGQVLRVVTRDLDPGR